MSDSFVDFEVTASDSVELLDTLPRGPAVELEWATPKAVVEIDSVISEFVVELY